MSHQPFESWLLSDELLAPDQVQELRTHLKSCESCQELAVNWRAVKQIFTVTPRLIPEAGFTSRWQARLALENSRAVRLGQFRQSFLFFLINAVSAIALFFLITFRFSQAFGTPVELLVFGIDRLTSYLHFIKATQDILQAVVLVMTSVISLQGWIILASVGGLVSLAWILSLRRLMIPRRIIL